MAQKTIVVIPHPSGKVLWEVMQGIKNQTFHDFTIEIVDNKRMGLPADRTPTYGHRAVTYIKNEFDPDVIIFYPADWIMYDNTIFERIMHLLNDKEVIGAGLRPRTREGGSWHLASYDECIHWSGFISAYKRDLYPYVDKIFEVAPNTDVWHEACYYACQNGYKFMPVFGLAVNSQVH